MRLRVCVTIPGIALNVRVGAHAFVRSFVRCALECCAFFGGKLGFGTLAWKSGSSSINIYEHHACNDVTGAGRSNSMSPFCRI